MYYVVLRGGQCRACALQSLTHVAPLSFFLWIWLSKYVRRFISLEYAQGGASLKSIRQSSEFLSAVWWRMAFEECPVENEVMAW